MNRLHPRNIARRQAECAASKAHMIEATVTLIQAMPPRPDETAEPEVKARWLASYARYREGLTYGEKSLLARGLATVMTLAEEAKHKAEASQ